MSATVRTLSEIQATCGKAARGAGCPWGMAEEAGLAVRQLEANGLRGAAALATLLTNPRACQCDGSSGAPACGLAALVELSDAPPSAASHFGPVAAPLLLVAPCLMMACDGSGWRVEWPGGAISCSSAGVVQTGKPAPCIAETITVTRIDPAQHAGVSPDWRGRAVSDVAWKSLEALASHTYVPETDASRAKGAGPDTMDTD
ncbi:DUF3726 domain-containing protein [Cognatiyoonia sp. IB215182]|uniref:DUF3726 domain-containing protein n=1 Tax=Cognatiyoonia sp. IB215182 TaxID=3097353 RepID=UPI002A110F6F|nr:DUF3726 domain-containing protein [Cognatiyoonia sp. IB215182]MDX8355833.1 DUF3726 domain-containing protein [Cognatiyoonia sp. IB215182]